MVHRRSALARQLRTLRWRLQVLEGKGKINEVKNSDADSAAHDVQLQTHLSDEVEQLAQKVRMIPTTFEDATSAAMRKGLQDVVDKVMPDMIAKYHEQFVMPLQKICDDLCRASSSGSCVSAPSSPSSSRPSPLAEDSEVDDHG